MMFSTLSSVRCLIVTPRIVTFICSFFFFFQAEDGIRDLYVTGVQTCALPISKLAVEYRQRYGKDIFIDMVCYRRHGHNESDEPKFTQPALYNLISKHQNPREVYNAALVARGDVDAKLAEQMDREFRDLLQARLDLVKQKPLPYKYQPLENEWRSLRRSTNEDFTKSPQTGISEEVVQKV